MKKLLAALLITISAATANAQTGSFLLYGNLDFNFYGHKYGSPERVQKGSIMPGIGIQVSEAITVGITGGYATTSTKKDSSTTKRTNTPEWRAGAFVRYNHRFSDMFSFYTQLEGGYRSGQTSYDGKEIPGSKFTGIFIGLTPVVQINVKNGFCLNFGFGGVNYLTTKFEKAVSTLPEPNTASNLDITFGKQINIGVSKNFGGHSAHKAHKSSNADEDDAPKKVRKVDDDE